MPQILSITQINEYIQGKMNADPMLAQVAVRGEISNYKCYPSGHHYFTLKDEASALKCVMFKGNAIGLRFRPANGMKVIALGRISVYPRDGAYQLYCSAMSVDGVGDLYAAFEQLKAKLASKGLFDPEKKKKLPKYPGTIGVVTSSAGAAVHDILRILRKRYPLAQVKLLPVRVQGAEAPDEIAAAIRYANAHRLADQLIVGRGGGSLEDLWAFNDERVAYAIYESEIPIISAVGHEPDVTIADYVADLRAATPSNGAELAVPDQEALLQNLDALNGAMAAALSRQLKLAAQRLDALAASPALRGPTAYLERKEKDLRLLKNRMISAQERMISASNARFVSCVAKLDAMSPLKVLSRGYAMAQTGNGELLRSIHQVNPGDSILVNISDGTITASVLNTKETEHESAESDV
ncbi:exodeoxyribonuclease VII large subunit [Pseudoflavonifractor sp. MSJ-30]|uniref:exodeoxyribonuclease VII large subunit n=1 Tax=Pseudoflavonifractor sp. MSJ-30 TaxID=2841525 RepID=UPI001C0FE9F3|nr:exodeoxyribonuclease VII large subunit [Pseudoflavonifractor sp. MSJ-30]MBU5452085.1 exodeoxyribonuclease VII large subunit [Pseudoflavonifractor sp. MSJ-30]